MTVNSTLPWPLRLLAAGILVGAGVLFTLWAYEQGRAWVGMPTSSSREQTEKASLELTTLRTERERHVASITAAESQLNIERSAQKQMASQLRNLEMENARLKEDIAFFESLMPGSIKTQGVAIRRMQAKLLAPEQLQYRLLVMQGGKAAKDFDGSLQLSVTVVQNGRSAIITFPDGKSSEINNFRLGFRHYQRLEGVLTLPSGVVVQSMQARVLEKGLVRIQQTLNL